MSTQAPWLALAVDWQDSDMFDDATPEVRLAWICLLCHVKTHGRAGVATARRGVLVKRYRISKTAVDSMMDRAEKSGAIETDAHYRVSVTNWRTYQDPKHRSAKAQPVAGQAVTTKRGSFSKRRKNDATPNPVPSTQNPLPLTPPTPRGGESDHFPDVTKKGQKRTPRKQTGPNRKPNPYWDAVVAVWFSSGVPELMRSKVGKLVAGFQAFDPPATEDEMRKRRAVARESWGPGKDTAFSVLNHWGELAPPASGARPNSETVADREARRKADETWALEQERGRAAQVILDRCNPDAVENALFQYRETLNKNIRAKMVLSMCRTAVAEILEPGEIARIVEGET